MMEDFSGQVSSPGAPVSISLTSSLVKVSSINRLSIKFCHVTVM